MTLVMGARRPGVQGNHEHRAIEVFFARCEEFPLGARCLNRMIERVKGGKAEGGVDRVRIGKTDEDRELRRLAEDRMVRLGASCYHEGNICVRYLNHGRDAVVVARNQFVCDEEVKRIAASLARPRRVGSR